MAALLNQDYWNKNEFNFQYVNSVNCMMELRFAVLTLNLPLVIAVVGSGRQWKYSEVLAIFFVNVLLNGQTKSSYNQ